MSRERAPGMALLHPLAPLSLLVLLLNDHWLKHAHPGLVSGKLSDFAAVFLLPLLLHALFELGIARGTGRAPRASLSNAALLICVGVTCIVFALPEVWKPAETAYCFGVAALQWPFRALFALSQGHAPQALRPVAATADVTDLLALPSAYVAWKIARLHGLRGRP